MHDCDKIFLKDIYSETFKALKGYEMSEKVSFSYTKLWKLLIEKKLNKTQLKELAQISTNAVAKMGRNESVSMETLGKICCALECEIGDIVEISEVQNETSSI